MPSYYLEIAVLFGQKCLKKKNKTSSSQIQALKTGEYYGFKGK